MLEIRGKAVGGIKLGRREKVFFGDCLREEFRNWSLGDIGGSREEDVLVDKRKDNFLGKMGKLGNRLFG